jgi:pimeloyl-ACP methyl ester carboxylesterase
MKQLIESRSLSIPIRRESIDGDLNIHANSRAVVVFAHGSGSSRHSPRNRHVARYLNQTGFSTLLLDLLTSDEEIMDQQTAHLRFDINFLAERLVAVTDWLPIAIGEQGQHVFYFGASTGAAAALVAAAKRPKVIVAIVSRGGRPDLAGPELELVRAPTLLIVGEYDDVVIELNRRAAANLRAFHRIEIVPGATHLFEEPGALDEVAVLARKWFEEHLVQTRTDVA